MTAKPTGSRQTYEPDGTLRARIFIGVPLVGKTEILKRIDTKSLQGLC